MAGDIRTRGSLWQGCHLGGGTSSLRLDPPVLARKAKSELFSALFKLHHLANWMYHQLEENEAKRSSLLPFEWS